jgi:hypothetical protein
MRRDWKPSLIPYLQRALLSTAFGGLITAAACFERRTLARLPALIDPYLFWPYGERTFSRAKADLLYFWPVLVFVLLVAVLSAVVCSDSRPEAWIHLARTVDGIMRQRSHDPLPDED